MSQIVIALPLLVTERENADISRRTLAKRTGIDWLNLWAIETGRSGVTPTQLGLIARALNITPIKLMGAKEVEGEFVFIDSKWQPVGVSAERAALLAEHAKRPYLIYTNKKD